MDELADLMASATYDRSRGIQGAQERIDAIRFVFQRAFERQTEIEQALRDTDRLIAEVTG